MFEYQYDYSIVMGYYNRKTQVEFTLKDFEEKYKNYNYEVIIIDDNSTPEHRLDDIIKNYTFPITYNVISEKEKGSRINPCVVYNKGFKLARGKFVFIQNPECCHIGNLFEYINNNKPKREYLAFSCYNITNEQLMPQFYNNTKIINDLMFKEINKQFGMEWYNHPQFRPVHYHFCAVIENDYLRLLGGFDELMKDGYWYDDNELLMSINFNLGLEIKTIDPKHGMVVHQFHKRDSEKTFTAEELENKRIKNNNLLRNMLENHNYYNFKFPKLLHLYWDGSPLSYLNLCTVLSFNKYNAFWKINVYTESYNNETLHKNNYNGKDYFEQLYSIPNVFIHKIDFNNINFPYKDADHLIKSDFIKYYVLNKFGGVFCDFDIIFQKSIEETYINNQTNDEGLQEETQLVCYSYKDEKINNILVSPGLLFANSNNSFLTLILKNTNIFYNKDKSQCLGVGLLTNLIYNENFKEMFSSINKNEIQFKNANIFLPIKWFELKKYYSKDFKDLYYNCLGFHWYNNSHESEKYLKNLSERTINKWENNSLMDKLISQYFNEISL